MGGSFSGTFFGASVQHNYAKIVNNTMQTINQSCGNGDTSSVSISNVQIKAKNIKCKNIKMFVQSANSDPTCALRASFKAVNNQLTQEIAGAQAKGGVTGQVTVFGANVKTNSTNIHNDINQAMTSKCSNENTAAASFKNVEMDFDNVSCDSLKILTQNASIQSKCALAGYQDALNKNKVLDSAGDDAGSGSIVLMVVAGVVIVSVVGTVGYLLLDSHSESKAVKHHYKHGTTSAGSEKSDHDHRVRCGVASMKGHPPPPGCDERLSQHKKKKERPASAVRRARASVSRATEVKKAKAAGKSGLLRKAARFGEEVASRGAEVAEVAA